MSENEAKEKLQAYIKCQESQEPADVLEQCDKNCTFCELCYAQGLYGEHKEAVQMAIKALEEIQQYRAIGTLEECRAAVEKQKAKRPLKKEKLPFTLYTCPVCALGLHTNVNYCDECGQKLRWRDEENE